MKATNNYWNNNGRFQALADKLNNSTLIPMSGPVENAEANPKLELFRRASRVYYDVFNNGLCNRAREFKPIFGFAARDYQMTVFAGGRKYRNLAFDAIVEPMDKVMDRIILEAALEQDLIEEVR